MRHELFVQLGDDYPHALQKKYPHVFRKLVQLWNTESITDYFTSLLIDTRGGRKGFDDDAFKDIHRLYKFRDQENLRLAEEKAMAIKELESIGLQFNNTEFLKTVSNGNQRLVDLFIKAGINVNAKDEMGDSALKIAFRKQYSIIANILVKAGADIDIHDDNGLPLLLGLCSKNSRTYSEMARHIIMMGVDVNTRDRNGWTPLMFAIQTTNDDLVMLLLEHGANPTLKTNKGDNAIDLAKKFGRNEYVDILLAKSENENRFL